MKRKSPVWCCVLLLAACGEKETPAEAADAARPECPNRTTALAPAADDSGEPAGDVRTKVAERPPVEKKPPVAEPVPDKPGMVKSPFSGKFIDVRGIPAGALVADPMFPSGAKKHFRVPEMPEDEITAPAEEAEVSAEQAEQMALAPVARQVSGNQSLIFSPYNNQIIDVSAFAPGSVIQDPTSRPGEPRYIRIPDGAEAEETEISDP